MSKCRQRTRCITWAQAALLVLSGLAGATPTLAAHGPVDMPISFEPRVPVAKCLSYPGLVASEGNRSRFFRVEQDQTLYSRDLLVAIPGFKVDVTPTSKAVTLTLWGNLPGLSDSPVLESAVILHDSRAYDLDFTVLRGRVVLTNTKAKGKAEVWLRTEAAGVEVILPEPGDSVALEIYGRWPTGIPFSFKHKPGVGPVRIWEVHCLKGKVEIQAGPTTWYMAAPPGPAYFHGDSLHGAAVEGPQRRKNLPDWADPKTKETPLAKKIRNVVDTFRGKLKAKDPEEVGAELMLAALKDKDRERASVIRQLVIHAMGALDEVAQVARILENAPHPIARASAVLALRHWIGARDGRDEKLYEILQHDLHYTKVEAETIMQLLHSPYDPHQPETYETLIAYLGHRKQAVRELAHWHLVRLAPVGRDVPYDAAAPRMLREKAIQRWKKLIPSGELPKDKPDDTKKKSDE